MPLPGVKIGNFLPFDKPVPVPNFEPSDPQNQWVVCFNVNWLPWVLGAVAVLARAEIYAASDADELILAVERGEELLASFAEGCAVIGNTQTILRELADGCGIQWSMDGGENWSTINLAGCIADIVGIGTEQLLQDGLLGPIGGSLQPIQPPPPTVCATHHIMVWGGSIYTLAVPVSTGDTIEVTNATGGAWSITGLIEWGCPDGRTYMAGDCVGDRLGAMDGDRYQDIHHLALVLDVGSHHIEAVNGLYTVPEGIENVYPAFEINGDTNSLLYNGNYEFDVEICKTGWHESFDFRSGLHGWVLYLNTTQDSQGLHAVQWSSYTFLNAAFNLTRQATLVTARVTGHYTPGSNQGDDVLRLMKNAGNDYLFKAPYNGIDTDFDMTFTVGQTMSDQIALQFVPDYNGQYGGAGIIETLELWGQGQDPFQ